MRNVLIGFGSISRATVTLLLLSLTLGYHEAVAQMEVCPEENYYLRTQGEVDTFPSGCNEIIGSLWIGPSADISDLTPLSEIESVGGELSIHYDNPLLINVDGLSGLASVGTLSVGGDQRGEGGALTNIDGLSNLTSAGGISIAKTFLKDLDGLSGLTSVGWVYLWQNSISNIDGLRKLTTAERISISSNSRLTNVDGLSSLTSVGDLIIDGSPLDNLDGLSNLASAERLVIYTTNAPNLDGLSNLVFVGDLWLSGVFSDMDGLSSLTSVEGDLYINCRVVKDWNGLSNIRRVGGDLTIATSNFTNLDVFSGLTSVGGLEIVNTGLVDIDGLSGIAGAVDGTFRITGNDLLTNLDGLSGITSLGEGLSIVGNASLTNVDGLSGVTAFEERIWIERNDRLSNLDGLSGITGRVHEIALSDNAMLTDISGLSGITSVHNLSVTRSALTNLDDLSGLSGSTGDLLLDISDNAELTDIDALSNVTGPARIQVRGNDALVNLDGLSGLTSVAGEIWITDNDALTNLDGLSNLTGSVDGFLWIAGNGALTNLSGIKALTSVGEEVWIAGNGALTNLDGLSAITSVGEYISISWSDALTNVDGLSALNSVGGSFSIRYNNALTNLNGLSGITSVGGDLRILGNTELSYCSCGLYACASGACVAGTITMANNAPSGDCNNDGADLLANQCEAPDAVMLVSPDNGATEVAAYTTFSWAALDSAAAYHLQVASDAELTSLVIDDSTLTDASFTVTEPLAYSTTYYWHVRAALDDGFGKTTGLLFGPWSETRSFTIAVGTAIEGEPGIPTAFALHPAYPNPFNPSTTIRYDVPKATTVRLVVFDALGRLVEELRTKNQAPGTYATTWQPRAVPSGVYFVRMEAGSYTATRKLMLTK